MVFRGDEVGRAGTELDEKRLLLTLSVDFNR